MCVFLLYSDLSSGGYEKKAPPFFFLVKFGLCDESGYVSVTNEMT